MTPELVRRAIALVGALEKRTWTVTTAESCTGGLVAGLLTEVPGVSAVLNRGFVTYSNAAKAEMLDVNRGLIERVGAVSQPVAVAMAEGALSKARADIAVAITGIAGPGGGSERKPVGLVHFACAERGKVTTVLERRYGDLGRSAIRLAAVGDALGLLEAALRN